MILLLIIFLELSYKLIYQLIWRLNYFAENVENTKIKRGRSAGIEGMRLFSIKMIGKRSIFNWNWACLRMQNKSRIQISKYFLPNTGYLITNIEITPNKYNPDFIIISVWCLYFQLSKKLSNDAFSKMYIFIWSLLHMFKFSITKK